MTTTTADDLPKVVRVGDTVVMALSDWDDILARLLLAEADGTGRCDEPHADADHDALMDDIDSLRGAIVALFEAYHRTHDERFAARHCTNRICADTARVLRTSW